MMVTLAEDVLVGSVRSLASAPGSVVVMTMGMFVMAVRIVALGSAGAIEGHENQTP